MPAQPWQLLLNWRFAIRWTQRSMRRLFLRSSSKMRTASSCSWWRAAIPAFVWLRSYQRAWVQLDLVAGVTLAAYLLPAALGDASLANLPPQAGLYACLFAGLVFWIFCSSRQTAVSITSAISLVIGSSLGEITGGNTMRFGVLAAATALLVALIAFIAWIARAGVLVHFISESVMTGFKCGVALFLASTQLPKLFGFHGAHGSFWGNTGFFFSVQSRRRPSVECLSPSMAGGSTLIGKISRSRRRIWSPDSAAAFPSAAAPHNPSSMKRPAHARRSPMRWRQFSFLSSFSFSPIS